jgi:outer membrane protein assembly factor BamB
MKYLYKKILLLFCLLLTFQNILTCKEINIKNNKINKKTEKIDLIEDIISLKKVNYKLIFKSNSYIINFADLVDNELYLINYDNDFNLSNIQAKKNYKVHLNKFNINKEKLIWSLEIKGTPISEITISKNNIYFGTMQGPLGFPYYDYYIFKLNRENGKLLWKYKITGEVSSNIVLENNMLFFGTKGYKGGYIFSIDPDTGKENWSYKISNNEYVNNNLIVFNDYIIFYEFTSCFKALKISKKREVWEYLDKINNSISFSPPVTKSDKLYFAGDGNALFYCLDLKSGKLMWSIKNKPKGIRGFTNIKPQIVDDKIYFPDSNFFYAVNIKNKNIENEFSFEGYLFNSFVVDNNIAYILLEPKTTRARDDAAYDRRYLIAVDLKTNKVLWKLQKGITNFLIHDDNLYFSSDNKIYELKLTEKNINN